MNVTVLAAAAANSIEIQVPTRQPKAKHGLRGSPRLEREHKTIRAMIACYCEDHHQSDDGLCLECQDLLDYATLRLERCRFADKKPTCANCPVHCYQAQRREQVRLVMRYAGPRMLWQHPILAIRHLLDGQRNAPALR